MNTVFITGYTTRVALLCIIGLAWIHANTVFTPWAESMDPRLWLYDTLFYAGFVLLFWGAGEALGLVVLWRKSNRDRHILLPVSILAIPTLVALLFFVMHHTGTGWRWRVYLSRDALESRQLSGNSDQRQRAGWLLIDSLRAPCGNQSWLWLGRPHGGGTGINLALVYSPHRVPRTPRREAFRFWQVNDEWWMAYQNPVIYQSLANAGDECTEGIPVKSHSGGIRHIRARD